MPSFNPQDMLMQDYTPQTKQYWKVFFPNRHGILVPAFTAKTSGLPGWNYEEWTIDYMAKKRYGAGKKNYDPIDISMYNPIDNVVAQELVSWCRLIHDELTGLSGYTSIYKQTLALEIWDGLTNVSARWVLKGAWPQAPKFGEMDYADGTPIEVSATFRYDEAILEF